MKSILFSFVVKWSVGSAKIESITGVCSSRFTKFILVQAKVDLLDFLTEDRYSPSDISDLSLISTDVLRSNLSELSSAPHLAGKERDEALAIMIRDTLIAYGLDSVQMNPYEMLLSYPSSKDTNQVNTCLIPNETHQHEGVIRKLKQNAREWPEQFS